MDNPKINISLKLCPRHIEDKLKQNTPKKKLKEKGNMDPQRKKKKQNTKYEPIQS